MSDDWKRLVEAEQLNKVAEEVAGWSGQKVERVRAILDDMAKPKRGEAKMVQRSGSPGTSRDTLPFDQVTPHEQYLEATRPEREARIKELNDRYPGHVREGDLMGPEVTATANKIADANIARAQQADPFIAYGDEAECNGPQMAPLTDAEKLAELEQQIRWKWDAEEKRRVAELPWSELTYDQQVARLKANKAADAAKRAASNIPSTPEAAQEECRRKGWEDARDDNWPDPRTER